MIKILLIALALSAVEAAAGPTAELDALIERMAKGGTPEELSVNARFETSLKSVPVRAPVRAPTPKDRDTQAVEDRKMSLADKAELFETRTTDEHRPWLGLILSRRVDADGKMISYDNFGDCLIWTGNYIAAQAYRFAVTHEEDALKKMEESLWGIVALHEATGNPGHVARVLVPRAYGESIGFKPEDKPANKRHYAKGKWEGWIWEGDNSLDSYDGFLFGVAASWPHIRDPKLRAEIKNVMLQVGLHVMRNNMRVIGEGDNTFQDFRANYFYQDRLPKWARSLPLPNWRAGNSLHGLHTMKVASMVTQDPRLLAYYRQTMILENEFDLKIRNAPKIEEIVEKHGHLLQAAGRAWSGDPEVRATKQSLRSDIGNNLQHMALYDVLRLETDPEIRKNIKAAWVTEHKYVAGEGNTYWNFLYASQVEADPKEIAQSVDTLRRYPTRKVLGQAHNSEDPTIPKYKGMRGDLLFPTRWFTDKPLPFEKRAMSGAFFWQHNPYQLDGGASDDEQPSGMAYQIAYWLGRYHGYIGPQD